LLPFFLSKEIQMSKLIEKIEQLKALLGNVVNGVGEVSQAASEQEKMQDERYVTLSELTLARDTKRRDEIASLEQSLEATDANVNLGFGAIESLKQRMSAVESKILNVTSPIDPTPVDPIPTPKLIIPEGSTIIPLQSTEIANISRSNSLVSTGIPIAEELNVTDVSRLVMLVEQDDDDWVSFPADFRPTAWWRTAKSPNGIMFVQVSFLDSFSSGQKLNYRLAIVPETHRVPNPELPNSYLDAIHDKASSTIMVDTGTAKFTIGAEGVFRSIEQSGQELLSDSKTSITFDGKTDTFSDTYIRRMEIEYLGPLVCYIVVETITNSLAIGTFQTNKNPARFSTVRRYQFVRGSGLCTIQNVLRWEGTKNGANHLMPDGKTLNSVIGTSWRDTIQMEYDSTKTANVDILDTDSSLLSLAPRKSIGVIQRLRTNRKEPRVSEIEIDGTTAYISKESKGILRTGNFIAGLQNMSQHEPQALRFNTENGILSLEYASDKFHLAFNQGVCITSILGVIKEDDTRTLASIWGDLNHPMRVFPVDPDYYNASAFGPVPEGPTVVDTYREGLSKICNRTLELTSRDGLFGLMTSHTAPRSWDDSWMETSDKDPKWDSLFATSAFTDYYSTFRSSAMLSLITGNPKYLDLLSFPSAQRMLHTQIIQCAPEDPWSKAGWGFTGYAAYRSDGNSSHSYYENLFWYYLLTGDRLVTDILTRGERILAGELKSQNVAGRFPNQHMRAQRFLFHCHYEESNASFFLASWQLLTKRAIDECYVEGTYNGKPVALWVESIWNPSNPNPVKWESSKKRTGLLRTPNLYAFCIWDLETLWQCIQYASEATRKELERKYILLVRTIETYGSSIVKGDSSFTRSSLWSRAFKFTWDGNLDPSKSVITNLTAGEDTDGTTTLYPDDIPGMAGAFARAASLTNDPIMIENSRKIVNYTLNRILTANEPMNKLSGLMDSTLAAAIYEEENR
jgi:hypothetical protein